MHDDPTLPDDPTVPSSGRLEPGRREAPLPDTIGEYRILERIGEGGMGTVYRAEQTHPHREVALKVIRAGFGSPDLLRRFELESEILARLEDPGIARIFASGTAETEGGRVPYFAMELIRGIPLDRFVLERRLSRNDLLRLFARVADAVHHAHQKGIIHRDLKPGNILVTEAGEPKILDFGIARATDSDIQATMQTDIGQVIGTLPYMSPEQIRADPRELDTRSDVYTLGVILYQLLAGSLPHDLAGRTLIEAARMILETEPPSLRSRVTRMDEDVATIVAKALEKEKDRRYGSAAELASDLRRYLADEPILARPPSTVYQLRKFARRNRGLVVGAVTVLVILVAGIAVSLSQAELARREARKASSVNAFLNSMLASANPMMTTLEDSLKGRDVKVVELLGAAAARLDEGELSGEPLIEASVRQTLGVTYRDLGDFEAAKQQLEKARELRRTKGSGKDLETAGTLNELAMTFSLQGDYATAEPLYRESLRIRRDRLAPDHPEVAAVEENLAELLQNDGRFEEADSLYKEALTVRRNKLEPGNPDIAETLNNRATLLADAGDLDQAEPLFREALEIRRRHFGDVHPHVARTLHDYASLLESQGKLSEAEAMRRESVDIWKRLLGEDHPFVSAGLVNLASLLKDQGRLEEAEPLYARALEIQRKTLTPGDPDLGASLYNLAKLEQAEGYRLKQEGKTLGAQAKFHQAETHFGEAYRILEAGLPADHPVLAGVMSGIGSVLTDLDRPEAGETWLRKALRIYETTYPDLWYADQVKSQLGESLVHQGRYPAAEELLLPSYEVLMADPGVSEDRRQQATRRIAELYEAWSRQDPGKTPLAGEWRTRVQD